MAIQVKSVTILNNPIGTPVNRVTDILGMNIDKLHVRVELDAGSGSVAIPGDVPIEVMALEPTLHRTNMSSMTSSFKAVAKRQPNSFTYTVTIDPSSFAPFMKHGDTLKEVSTVVRAGGTSSRLFRGKLTSGGWASRGAGKQPAEGKPAVTGNIPDEQPDAKTLMLAGGVEVLEVSVPKSSGLQLGPMSKTWIFVRSPADIVFYSGHGAWWNCNLLREQAAGYEKWLSPEQLLDSWKKQVDISTSPWDIDVLIINGCSVIGDWGKSTFVDDYKGARTLPPCATRWKKLLTSEDGPLLAILSYRDTAPYDSNGGDRVALDMAKAIVDGLGDDWDSYAKKWVEINARYPQTRTAAAVDNSGYWYINQKMALASHTHEARPMAGYNSKLPEGTVIGPVPVPTL